MKSVFRWVARHGGLCKLILLLGLVAFSLYAARFEYVSFLSVYLIDLVLWFLLSRFIATAPAKLARESHEQLSQHCDPYPLLEQMEQMLDWNLPGIQHQVVQMDYAVALRETGHYQKAAEVLESIHIDKFPGTTPYVKYVYYHNLCDILYLLDRKEEARIWFKKSLEIYGDIPSGKARQSLTQTHDMMAAEVLYWDNEPYEALRQVAKIKLPAPRNILDAALLAAKCHLRLDEPEKAREKLRYIIEHGNKLHIVEEAKILLESID